MKDLTSDLGSCNLIKLHLCLWEKKEKKKKKKKKKIKLFLMPSTNKKWML